MDHAEFMRLAVDEGRAALEHEDVPIGAVAVLDGEVISSAHNERELRGDPTAHAEILALQQASSKIGGWRLDGLSLYVTIEPCPMCAGALVAARIDHLVYGAYDERAGAAYSLYNIVQDPRLNHSIRVTTGVLGEECAGLIQEFFRKRRKPQSL